MQAEEAVLARLDATLKQIKKYPEQWPLEVQKTLPAPWQSAVSAHCLSQFGGDQSGYSSGHESVMPMFCVSMCNVFAKTLEELQKRTAKLSARCWQAMAASGPWPDAAKEEAEKT